MFSLARRSGSLVGFITVMASAVSQSEDPFGEKRGRFDYQGLLTRLGATHLRIREKTPAEDEHNGDSDSNSSSSETDPDSQGSSQP